MAQSSVLEYKCPCCDAGLTFAENTQKLTCEYCDNSFDLETVQAYNADKIETDQESFQWESQSDSPWKDEEEAHIQAFQCPSCGGELITDDQTAATFCPYCGNPTILPGRLSGSIRPDAVIPFKTSKEDAVQAFLRLCKGKPLLPKLFTQEQHVEKITGIYVPFWLYDCSADFHGNYKATRVHRWSDARYHYTKTDHYMLTRAADAQFSGIPMDGSSKMEDSFMESIEPYDYSQLENFDMVYLSGFLADKYDVEASTGQSRIQQRVTNSMDDMARRSIVGYTTVVTSGRNTRVDHSKATYVLLPVWILNTIYNGKTYTFAMNGQTGKMTGAFPVCPKRTAAWFAGIFLVAGAVASFVQLLI